MANSEYKTLEEVSAGLTEVNRNLQARDRLDEERRKIDDAREAEASRARRELIERVDVHGRRTTVLETRFEAFFGDQGAFKIVMKSIETHDAKLDKLLGWVKTGIGIATLAAILLPIIVTIVYEKAR